MSFSRRQHSRTSSGNVVVDAPTGSGRKPPLPSVGVSPAKLGANGRSSSQASLGSTSPGKAAASNDTVPKVFHFSGATTLCVVPPMVTAVPASQYDPDVDGQPPLLNRTPGRTSNGSPDHSPSGDGGASGRGGGMDVSPMAVPSPPDDEDQCERLAMLLKETIIFRPHTVSRPTAANAKLVTAPTPYDVIALLNAVVGAENTPRPAQAVVSSAGTATSPTPQHRDPLSTFGDSHGSRSTESVGRSMSLSRQPDTPLTNLSSARTLLRVGSVWFGGVIAFVNGPSEPPLAENLELNVVSFDSITKVVVGTVVRTSGRQDRATAHDCTIKLLKPKGEADAAERVFMQVEESSIPPRRYIGEVSLVQGGGSGQHSCQGNVVLRGSNATGKFRIRFNE